jgi:hypothetical protein
MPAPSKKTIVWDLDDVLNPLMEAWLEQGWKVERPDCTTAYGELVVNPPAEVLGCTLGDYLESLDRFRSSGAAAAMAPNAQVLEWFHERGSAFEHHILTARPVGTVAPASAWAFTHLGRWIRHFHFVPSARDGEKLPGYAKTKDEVLARIGPVDFFVDDSAANVSQARALGIRSYIFPQPWNASDLTVDGILAELTCNSSE